MTGIGVALAAVAPLAAVCVVILLAVVAACALVERRDKRREVMPKR